MDTVLLCPTVVASRYSRGVNFTSSRAPLLAVAYHPSLQSELLLHTYLLRPKHPASLINGIIELDLEA